MHQIGSAILGKEFSHALGHHTAKTIDLADLLLGCFPDGLQRAKMLCQQCSGLITDVADSKRKHQLVQIVLLGSFDRLQQIVCALFLELFQCEQLLYRQVIEICRRVYQPLIHQLRGDHGTQTVDVHGIPGCEVDDIAECLRRAFRVDTAQSGFIFQVHCRGTAGGAEFWHLVLLCIRFVAGHTNDLRNDITRLAHLNGISDTQTQLTDKIFIVKGGTGNCGSCQKHRVKAGGGSQNAGASHADFNTAQCSLLDLGRILERNGPAREFVGGTHQFPLCKVVHLDHGTVHIKIQCGTVLADLLDLCNGILDIVHDMITRGDRQTQTLEVVKAFGMAGQLLAPHLLNVEYEDGQPPAAGDLRILLTQRPCGGIARIFERCRTL